MFAYDKGDVFFLYILPHGLLELTAIFVAAAGGLRIFWAWIAPGARTRGQALAEDARALFTVAIGLVFVLLVSGIIEGFVTPAPWPWPVKIGIGALALAAVPRLHARRRQAGHAARARPATSASSKPGRAHLRQLAEAGRRPDHRRRPMIGYRRPAAFNARYRSESAGGRSAGGAVTTSPPS